MLLSDAVLFEDQLPHSPNADPVIWMEKQKERGNQDNDQKGKEKQPVPYPNDNGVKLWYIINGTGEPDRVSGTYHMIEEPEQTAPVVIDFVRKHL